MFISIKQKRGVFLNNHSKYNRFLSNNIYFYSIIHFKRPESENTK